MLARERIKSLMKSGELSSDQALNAVADGVITSDEMFDFFKYGTIIDEHEDSEPTDVIPDEAKNLDELLADDAADEEE
jgi:hypothetical protein